MTGVRTATTNSVPRLKRTRSLFSSSHFRLPLFVMVALAVMSLVIVLAVFGDALAPYPHTRTNVQNTLLPPTFVPGGDSAHLLGTDHLGRDIFSRLLFSIRVTAIISLFGATVAASIGTLLGILAGHARGWLEEMIMMAVDVQSSLPFIVFALTALAVMGNSFSVLLLVVAINGWEGYARLARAMTLSIKEREYVTAARALGAPTVTLYRRHVFPNMVGTLMIEFSLTLAGTILLETALSFLGLGVQPPMTSLGQMLGEGRDYLLFAPWLSIVPGTTIFLIIASISALGDWLRDVLDPTV